jgi:hypothetical protein
MLTYAGGYDSIFGLVLLACAGVVPQLVTTVHDIRRRMLTYADVF